MEQNLPASCVVFSKFGSSDRIQVEEFLSYDMATHDWSQEQRDWQDSYVEGLILL